MEEICGTRITGRSNNKQRGKMAKCPYCSENIQPERDKTAQPENTGEGIVGGTWICPECETVLSVSEIDVL